MKFTETNLKAGNHQTSSHSVTSDKDFEADQEGQELTLDDVIPKLDKPWFRTPHLLRLNILLLCGMLSNVSLGYDGSMLNGLQSLPAWRKYFNHPSGAILGTLANGTNFGYIVLLPFASFICDKWGRKRSLIAGCIAVVAGATMQGFSNSYGLFLASRIILGAGAFLNVVASAPLVSETAYPTHRAIITAITLSIWSFGAFLAAAMTYAPYMSLFRDNNWSWRIPSLIQLFVPAIQICFAIFAPESPRWLIFKGRYEEALEILAKYHAGGDRDSPLVKFEMAEIIATLEMEKAQNRTDWGEWFKTKATMHRLSLVIAVGAFSQISGNALIAYYLTIMLNNMGVTNTAEQLRINMALTIWGLTAAITFALCVKNFGRRPMFLTAFGGMCTAYVIFTILSARNAATDFKDKNIGIASIAMMFIFSTFQHMATPVNLTYVMEICPFSLRAKGSTIYQVTCGICIIFNNYVNNIAMDAIKWKYYIVWCIWIAVEFTIVFFFYPETRGLALEEISAVFGEEIYHGDANDYGIRTFEGQAAEVGPDGTTRNGEKDGILHQKVEPV
ncbi:hypothetical protein BABINDRAFT_159979 [Babjeviella inositovora NRRL Y-12698]|uniref:Major facilitator superfamily (MFS) profile domain-containing protein n=1 Tax=Babjeviella inositovora NRRL Y-12698 TaxID=984486 RepID=A0A1E3QXD3_9ASCO|nr:uncharacterized protein BABINDRAFT_159979 [Babjeviella inositovora NRRL Y-12698]ODQ81732.1 hypothetical protein BABINDRAFT_159979 [Babjeviella inositovora NRRL Y-12698]